MNLRSSARPQKKRCSQQRRARDGHHQPGRGSRASQSAARRCPDKPSAGAARSRTSTRADQPPPLRLRGAEANETGDSPQLVLDAPSAYSSLPGADWTGAPELRPVHPQTVAFCAEGQKSALRARSPTRQSLQRQPRGASIMPRPTHPGRTGRRTVGTAVADAPLFRNCHTRTRRNVPCRRTTT